MTGSARKIISVLAAILTIALIVYLAYEVQHIRNVVGSGRQQSGESSAYVRMASEKQLRVAYFVEPPYLTKDSATGRLSGVFFDLTEELGHNLDAKVIWVEEANLVNLAAGMTAGRYDMIAFPLWRSAERAKQVSFSIPIFYTPVGTYVRDGDRRFDSHLERLNDPKVTISAIDGELAALIAKTDFPAARVHAMPQLVDYTQLLLEVASKKADATFFSKVYANRYIARNPGIVREVSTSRPIRLFAECFVLPLGDYKFNSVVNAALGEMLDNGAVEKALRKNGEDPADYYLVATPFSRRP